MLIYEVCCQHRTTGEITSREIFTTQRRANNYIKKIVKDYINNSPYIYYFFVKERKGSAEEIEILTERIRVETEKREAWREKRRRYIGWKIEQKKNEGK